MNTPGPATSVFTSVCAFPQKEQRYSRLRFWVGSAAGTVILRCQCEVDSQSLVDTCVNPTLTRLCIADRRRRWCCKRAIDGSSILSGVRTVDRNQVHAWSVRALRDKGTGDTKAVQGEPAGSACGQNE